MIRLLGRLASALRLLLGGHRRSHLPLRLHERPVQPLLRAHRARKLALQLHHLPLRGGEGRAPRRLAIRRGLVQLCQELLLRPPREGLGPLELLPQPLHAQMGLAVHLLQALLQAVPPALRAGQLALERLHCAARLRGGGARGGPAALRRILPPAGLHEGLAWRSPRHVGQVQQLGGGGGRRLE